ncbi:MAG: bifunctional (p)ppGpp synthetase/guanosine-3',5'-bis(diphosphate) 3'-pyrophosphohydrolase [Halioglobus sp.]
MQVREQSHILADGEVDLDVWLEKFPIALDGVDRQRILDACYVARRAQMDGQAVTSGHVVHTDVFLSGLDIAFILAELHVDTDCLLAGILYRAVREERVELSLVEEQAGEAVSTLVSGVLKMAAIAELPLEKNSPVLGQAQGQKDNIRKMLVAMVDDVRVALIKLAERTVAIRAVKEDALQRTRVGQEVFHVYAPLAHRLGIGHLKWELEDLSFRYIYPDAYRKIARLLDGKRLDRDHFIESVTAEVTRVLTQAGLEFEIAGRAKHIYSIWRKMQHKGIGFSQVYDIRAVRILVPEVKDCYATLGLVHGLWRNIPNEFDDYIASPKENGYRSLHTAVFGPQGKILEIQIRTHQMHDEAELGVCAHWRYKGSDAEQAMASTYEEKIAWLRQVLDWHEETGDARSVAEQFSFDVAQDRIYAFTPEGDVVNLANGATPLDFAYHVHTEIGHRCRGAKVNGSIVPLTHTLETGDRVEILTSKDARPRRDWLQADLEYLKTSRALAKVQHWFKGQGREDSVDAGRHLLDKHLKIFELTSVDYQRIARKVQCNTVEDMYAALGAGELSSTQILQAANAVVKTAAQPMLRSVKPVKSSSEGGVTVAGDAHSASHMAGCCQPGQQDQIVGFVTRNKGVTVHRHDCARLVKLRAKSPERIVAVFWDDSGKIDYEVDVTIEAIDRPGLLRDIMELFAQAQINVLQINTLTARDRARAEMNVTLVVQDLGVLSGLLADVEKLDNILSARRLD